MARLYAWSRRCSAILVKVVLCGFVACCWCAVGFVRRLLIGLSVRREGVRKVSNTEWCIDYSLGVQFSLPRVRKLVWNISMSIKPTGQIRPSRQHAIVKRHGSKYRRHCPHMYKNSSKNSQRPYASISPLRSRGGWPKGLTSIISY